MRRVGKHMGGVLRAALICGMGVQILLGLAWLIKNIGGLQNFQETRLLLAGESAADSFYSGILYRGLAALLSSRLWILYGFQLAAAVVASYGLMSCFFGREKEVLRLFGALALTTIPQAMQCHLAVLPWSLGTSLLLGETALLKRAWDIRGRAWGLVPDEREPGSGIKGQEAGRHTARRAAGGLAAAMLILWLLILLVLPLYAWFALPMIFALLWRMGKGWKGSGRLVCALAALALFLCSVTVNCGWDPGRK